MPKKTPEEIAQGAIKQLVHGQTPPVHQNLMPNQPRPIDPRGYHGLYQAPASSVPAYQTASYIFTIDSYKIDNTRSAHRDTNHVSLTVAVGANPANSLPVKDMGDQDNGTFPVGMSINTGQIADPNIGVVFHYEVLNSGHQDKAEINNVMKDVGNALASQGAKAATAAIGALAGLQAGTMVLPIIGSAIGAAAGWLVGALAGILGPNCDGPVAVESPAFKGIDLWAKTANGPFTHQTYHPGLDSAHGCGSNSKYTVNWTVRRG